MLEKDVTVGVTLTGALTPAGLGMSDADPADGGRLRRLDHVHRREPLPRHAFGLGLAMHQGNPFVSDVVLREEGVVRIYDIFFDY